MTGNIKATATGTTNNGNTVIATIEEEIKEIKEKQSLLEQNQKVTVTNGTTKELPVNELVLSLYNDMKTIKRATMLLLDFSKIYIPIKDFIMKYKKTSILILLIVLYFIFGVSDKTILLKALSL